MAASEQTRSQASVVGACLAWTLAAVSLVLLGFADWLPLSDDAFYYFEIARNASRGQGFTFDSVHPTNGFHPLWACLLLPVFRLLGEFEWYPVRASLILSASFVPLSAFLLFKLYARRQRPQDGRTAALFLLFNPFTLILALQGLEGPLNVAFATVILIFSWRVGRTERR